MFMHPEFLRRTIEDRYRDVQRSAGQVRARRPDGAATRPSALPLSHRAARAAGL